MLGTQSLSYRAPRDVLLLSFIQSLILLKLYFFYSLHTGFTLVLLKYLKLILQEHSSFIMLLVFPGQQSESAVVYTYIPSFFWISFQCTSPQSPEFPEMYSRFSLGICFIHTINSAYVSIPVSQPSRDFKSVVLLRFY